MKKQIALFAALYLGLSISYGQKPQGYIQSTSFKNSIAKRDDKPQAEYSTKRLFTLIGEEAFLVDPGYDYYGIYLYSNNKNTLTVYTLKSKNGIISASKKECSKITDLMYVPKGQEKSIYTPINFTVVSKIIGGQNADPLKNMLNIAVGKFGKKLPTDYNEPYRIAYYFNGKDYYDFSSYTLDSDVMNKLDLEFRQSKIFDNH